MRQTTTFTMIVSVIGQDTLAKATLECCSEHFRTFNYPNTFADVTWVAFDTPIADDKPDVEWVLNAIRNLIPHIKTTSLILISSQLPVGTTAKLEKEFPANTFAYQPENIRVKTAVEDFKNQSRMVVGRRSTRIDTCLSNLLHPFTDLIIFTDPETAEMSKAALNTFLALNITFANELARICSVVGADVNVVSEALKTDSRVSGKAPLRAGAPYGGGHLAREIFNLTQIAEKNGIQVPIISNIKRSNDG